MAIHEPLLITVTQGANTRKIHPVVGSIIAEVEGKRMATHRLEAVLAIFPTFAYITLAKVLNRRATRAFSMMQGCVSLLWGGAPVRVKNKSLPCGPGHEKEPRQGPWHLEAKCRAPSQSEGPEHEEGSDRCG